MTHGPEDEELDEQMEAPDVPPEAEAGGIEAAAADEAATADEADETDQADEPDEAADVEELDAEIVEHLSRRLRSIIESILFASGDPVAIGRFGQILSGYAKKDIKEALREIAAEYERDERGIRLVEVASGFQFRTAAENRDFVQALFQQRPVRITRASLETVSIVAYRQPATRAEVEAIRGVDCGGALNTLVERKLVRIAGRKDVIGRPLIYETTPEFLERFGMKDLSELPSLEEIGASAEAMERALLEVDEKGIEADPSEPELPFDTDGSAAREGEGEASEVAAPAAAGDEDRNDGDDDDQGSEPEDRRA